MSSVIKQIFFVVTITVLLSSCGTENMESIKESVQDTLETNKKPTATYYLDKVRYSQDEVITLDGSTSIDPDGEISSFVWSSDKDGQLGTESKIEVSKLSIGFHKITLTVTDSEGETNSFFKSIEIYEKSDSTSSTASPVGNFLDNRVLERSSAGFVSDSLTGLLWADSENFNGEYSVVKEYCENLRIGSISNWRVPTIKELWYLTNLDRSNPVADTYIWNYMKSAEYWSSTDVTFYGEEDNMRTIDFSTGEESWAIKDYKYSQVYVRCVSGDYNYTPTLKRDNENKIVTDSRNHLIWQDGEVIVERYYTEAQEYCDGLIFAGYSDWRLPTIRELYSIVDPYRNSEPYIYRTFFNSKNGDYTSSDSSGNSLWSIDFERGKIGSSRNSYIRCVREY